MSALRSHQLVDKKHTVMMYRFVSMKRAYDFEKLLVSLGVPAAAMFAEHFGWYVKTDTRCLEHAARLSPFIYQVGGAR